MIIIAHNIRSMYNVGSIFRNAAAFNIEKLYLTGITAQPPRKEIAKVALGAQDLLDWEGGDIAEIIIDLKKLGYKIYGLDNTNGASLIGNFDNKNKIAIVLGNEVNGIDDETKQLLDGLLEIPMGKKQSLNVSVASGIAMYILTR